MTHRLKALSGLLLSLCIFFSSHAAAAQTRVLIVVGLGGEPAYERQFQQHAEAAAKRLREVTDDVTLLLGESVSREAVRSTLAEINQRTTTQDALVVMLIGHGSYDGERFRFNVPGPDFTAVQLAGWLEPIAAKQQLVVVTGSSSGAVQGPLEQDGRTVITATKSGEERNATVFARYFSEALGDSAADVDKDHIITAHEAFSYAADAVDQHYTQLKEMATEHPLTNGPEGSTILARLERSPVLQPELSPLVVQRDALEQKIVTLRANKDSYPLDDYYTELQRLLLELVVVERQFEDPSLQTPR